MYTFICNKLRIVYKPTYTMYSISNIYERFGKLENSGR